jgi:hypothetical protein
MLNRAKSLFTRKTAEPKAEPVTIRCTCGRKVDALRRSDAQTLACEHCGAAVFVLPVNPLPRPGPPKRSKSARAGRSAPIAPMMEPVADETLDVDVPMPSENGGPRKRPAILDRRWLDDEPSEEEVERKSRPLISKRQWIALGVVAFVILGGYGFYRRTAMKELADNLPDRARRGFQLMQDGKIDEAYEPLRLAWKAIDWAGANHEQKDAIRQAYLEAARVQELMAEPLESALESSLAEPASFASRYRGRSILMDVEVEKNPEGGWTAQWVVPIGEGRFARLHSSGLKLFGDLGIGASTRILLAARVASVEASDEGLNLLLEPDSGVLVTEFAVLEKMGLASDSSADAVRRTQRELVVKP